MESPWEEVMRRNRQAKIIFKMSHCMGDGDISVKKTGFILIYSHSFLLDAAEIVGIMKWIINQKYCNESVYWMYGNPTVCINTWVWCVHTQGEIFNELVGNQLAHARVYLHKCWKFSTISAESHADVHSTCIHLPSLEALLLHLLSQSFWEGWH